MNVEFQIHGVLSNGQTQWKQNDQDYYTQFYSNRTEDVLMIVEIVNRPHGISSYYNYLRSNNVVSTRTGSYFGMTLRIDDAFCQDVKSIYMIMDNLFNKMIVGKILMPIGGNLKFTINSFDEQADFLLQLQNQFIQTLNAICTQQDFIGITTNSASQQKSQNINPFELSTSEAVNTIINNKIKLYLSPSYLSASVRQSIDNEVSRANRAVGEADKRIKAAENAKAQLETQHQADRNKWLQERVALEKARDEAARKVSELQSLVRNSNLNVSIDEKIAELKQPLTELTRLLATVSGQHRVTPPSPKPTPSKRVIKWLPWGLCLLLAIATISYSKCYSNKTTEFDKLVKSDSAKINSLNKSIEGLEEQVKQMRIAIVPTPHHGNPTIDIKPDPVAGKLKTNTRYTLKLLNSREPGSWVIRTETEYKQITGNIFTPDASYGNRITIEYINQNGVAIIERSLEIIK